MSELSGVQTILLSSAALWHIQYPDALYQIPELLCCSKQVKLL